MYPSSNSAPGPYQPPVFHHGFPPAVNWSGEYQVPSYTSPPHIAAGNPSRINAPNNEDEEHKRKMDAFIRFCRTTPTKQRSESYSRGSSRRRRDDGPRDYHRRDRGTYRNHNYKSDPSALERAFSLRLKDAVGKEKSYWIRSSPSSWYHRDVGRGSGTVSASSELVALCERFQDAVLRKKTSLPALIHEDPSRAAGNSLPSWESMEQAQVEELNKKKQDPDRLDPEIWHNVKGQLNAGPFCLCPELKRKTGVVHNIFPGETPLKKCDPWTNNADKLYHYRIIIFPSTNFVTRHPSVIEHDRHDFVFEGFSLLSHAPLGGIPSCKVIRFNIEHTIIFFEDNVPLNFTVKELDLFNEFLFFDILELLDLDWKAAGDPEGCPRFHVFPRFVRELPDKRKEILSMSEVLRHLIRSYKPLFEKEHLRQAVANPNKLKKLMEEVKGMIVSNPTKKPSSFRLDGTEKLKIDPNNEVKHPKFYHYASATSSVGYMENSKYKSVLKEYFKMRSRMSHMIKPSFRDKGNLRDKEEELQEIEAETRNERNVTIRVSSKGFYRTGIMCDVTQYALMMPSLVSHLRFSQSLAVLEKRLGYTFKDQSLLHLALTHPSYRERYGTNSDHVRNSLANCGFRYPKYGNANALSATARRRGIRTLINIMSKFAKTAETKSKILSNERLEFLGDAVIQLVVTVHLYHMFPFFGEGALDTYRSALVQNWHLAQMADVWKLEEFFLFGHRSNFCSIKDFRHALANCFEAVIGAIFLDGGIDAAGKAFGLCFLHDEDTLRDIWFNYPSHVLKRQEPHGDRHWIPHFPILQELADFEESIGVHFNHIRLLAKAFSHKSIGFNNLTLGTNGRLEYLGDSVLQLIVSEYLYKHFPEHHEGHLSLLRSSLVNNHNQSVVCDDLNLTRYAIYPAVCVRRKAKDKADLLEALIGAIFLDKGMEHCQTFCNVCFFPRLESFILHQIWNDPKSRIQQCCLSLRIEGDSTPEVPVYKVVNLDGPPNDREYTVAVYFRGKCLAQAKGPSIKKAEMSAAKAALEETPDFKYQLEYQKNAIKNSIKDSGIGSDSDSSLLSEEYSSRWSSSSSLILRHGKRKRDESSPRVDGCHLNQSGKLPPSPASHIDTQETKRQKFLE